jgi:hypothetical protein
VPLRKLLGRQGRAEIGIVLPHQADGMVAQDLRSGKRNKSGSL